MRERERRREKRTARGIKCEKRAPRGAVRRQSESSILAAMYLFEDCSFMSFELTDSAFNFKDLWIPRLIIELRLNKMVETLVAKYFQI